MDGPLSVREMQKTDAVVGPLLFLTFMLLVLFVLVNMFIGDPPGNTDRILDFSTAETGSLFFVPTIDFLDDPPELPAESAELAPSPTPPPPPAYPGSLAIGSLKGQPQ